MKPNPPAWSTPHLPPSQSGLCSFSADRQTDSRFVRVLPCYISQERSLLLPSCLLHKGQESRFVVEFHRLLWTTGSTFTHACNLLHNATQTRSSDKTDCYRQWEICYSKLDTTIENENSQDMRTLSWVCFRSHNQRSLVLMVNKTKQRNLNH